jgi:heat shock protein HslJ
MHGGAVTMIRLSAGRAGMLAWLALALCSCGGVTGPAASQDPATLAGVHWRLQSADGPEGSTTFPKAIDGWFEASTTGAITGSDGCVSFNATSHKTQDKLRVHQVISTANGCIHESAPRQAMRRAVYQALLRSHPARVTVSSARLVVRGSGYVLTYVNGGPATHEPEPTGDPSRTSEAS